MIRSIKAFNAVVWRSGHLCALVLLTISNASISSEEKTWIAVTENFPPYSFLRNNQPQGYATGLVNELASVLELDLTIEVLPWSRAMLKAESAPNVLIFSMLRTPERENRYHWIGPIDDMSIHIWQRKGDSALISKPATQITYAVSRSLDAINVTMLTEQVDAAEANIIAVETTEQLIAMLLRKRVDRIVLAENIWREVRKSLSEADFSTLERVDLLAERQLYLAASLQTELNAIEQLKSAFETLSGKPNILALKDRHGLN